MSQNWIEFSKVQFSYRKEVILHDLDLVIDQPQWVGVIGVNGSGKSTLLRLLLGLLTPQSGAIKVLGHPAGDFSTKHFVGSALQDIDFPSSEKVEEILNFICHQYQNSESVEELIGAFQLGEFRNKPCGRLSGGMKRRLSLACALAGKPKVLLLDEPTTGLDLESRLNLMDRLKHYQEKYQTLILMISHHPEEAVDFVHRFLHVKGKSVAPVSSEQMRSLSHLRKINFTLETEGNLPQALRLRKMEKEVEVVTENSDTYLKQLFENGTPVKNLLVSKLGVDELLGEFL